MIGTFLASLSGIVAVIAIPAGWVLRVERKLKDAEMTNAKLDALGQTVASVDGKVDRIIDHFVVRGINDLPRSR